MKTRVLLFAFMSSPFLLAQQQPLSVEPATMIEPGHAEVEVGGAYFHNQTYPLSGLSGNLYKLGNVRFCISLSRYVELQTDGTLLNVLDIGNRRPAFNSSLVTSRSPTADIGDFTVWTKFAIATEEGLGFGLSLRFGVQLPNASNESGLGIDEMNFFSSILFEKHFGGTWIANVGLGILGDPTRLTSQHDVCMYGVAYFLPVGGGSSFTVQHTGRAGHTGVGVNGLRTWKAGLLQQFTDHLSVSFLGIKNTALDDRAAGVEATLHCLFQIMNIP